MSEATINKIDNTLENTNSQILALDKLIAEKEAEASQLRKLVWGNFNLRRNKGFQQKQREVEQIIVESKSKREQLQSIRQNLQGSQVPSEIKLETQKEAKTAYNQNIQKPKTQIKDDIIGLGEYARKQGYSSTLYASEELIKEYELLENKNKQKQNELLKQSSEMVIDIFNNVESDFKDIKRYIENIGKKPVVNKFLSTLEKQKQKNKERSNREREEEDQLRKKLSENIKYSPEQIQELNEKTKLLRQTENQDQSPNIKNIKIKYETNGDPKSRKIPVLEIEDTST